MNFFISNIKQSLKQHSNINYKSILVKLSLIICLIGLLIILLLRLKESLIRGYGQPDEFSHLHYAYLLSRGKIPYKDFFNIYPPIFPLMMVPFFKILGDNFIVFTLARVEVYIYFLVYLFFTYRIARLFTTNRYALLMTLIASSMPMSYEKTLDIRPDNLMMALFFIGLFYLLKGIKINNKNDFFASGIFLTLSFITLTKIVFTFAGMGAGIFLLMVFNHKYRKIIIHNIIALVIGSLLIIFIYSLILLYFGIFTNTFITSVIDSRLIVSNLLFVYKLTPHYWFNRILFSFDPHGLLWTGNNVIFALALAGIIITIIRYIKSKLVDIKIVLILAGMSSFILLYLVQVPFQQYLIPFLSFVPFWVIWGMEGFEEFINKNYRLNLFSLFSIGLSLLLVNAVWQSWLIKKNLDDKNDRTMINYVLSNSSKDDVFWGEGAYYVFRLDGYPVYYDFQALWKVKERYPPFINTLEKNKVKFLMLPSSALVNKTWPYDQYALTDFRDWVLKNFTPTTYQDLWIKKQTGEKL